MTWSHTNTLTLNPAAVRKLHLETELRLQQLMVDEARSRLITYKLEFNQAEDEMLRIQRARSQPSTWAIHQLTCGHTGLADCIKQSLENCYLNSERRYQRALEEKLRAEGRYGEELERLNRFRNKLFLIRNQADIVVSKEMLDRSLRDNAHYRPDSLQLSINNDPELCRVTFSMRDIVATDPDGDSPIEIPPLRVDFYLHPSGDHDLVVRNDIGRPYWVDRYQGYSDFGLLHPHMTSQTTLCLGDFGGGVTEAISEGDFVTAITILTMFFQQYDPEDSAGLHFTAWPEAEFDEDRHIADYADA